MKKLYSLIRACMTSDMKIFKIKTKNNSKGKLLIPLLIALYLMFMIWGSANSMFERVAPLGLCHILLSLFVFGVSFMTFLEGIYKISGLIFNCKDDQLLLSLPIKKRTVLFIRVFKFYIFELLFNSLFLLPVMVAYIRWGNITYTYYITSIVMILLLPIIPIVLSLIVGTIISSISSRFKYKNIAQIILSMSLILVIFYLSYNMDNLFEYIAMHANSINDFITKLYYPAGAYANLVTNFSLLDLVIFIVVNVVIFVIAIFILSRYYFKINTKLSGVTTTTKKNKLADIVIKRRGVTNSLVRKEINTFFTTPVFIINAGFALVLFIILTIYITLKFDSFLPILTDPNGMDLSKDMIINHLSILIFMLISATSYLTSITNSVISLEGGNFNILKSLPVKTKTILMSKVYSSMLLTIPILVLGTIILCIKFKISIIEVIMLLILTILVPLVSHFIGILVNLKYPKLDFENSSEVVKQSISSFVSVMIGMVLLIISVTIIFNLIERISTIKLLLGSIIVYSIIDYLLYIYLIHKGVKEFNNLSI